MPPGGFTPPGDHLEIAVYIVCPENHTLCNAGFSYIVVKNSNNGKESYLCTKIFLFSSRTFSKMVAHLVT